MYAVCRSLPLTAVLAAAVSAHVVLENPKPFPFIDYGPTNPIAADGSDFPCKVPPGTALDLSAPATVMAIGEDQTLSFQGRAVHGGGSCQLALTKDRKPTKQSEWMVIHSIEGGCPARNQKGNLEGPNTDTYTFRIPAGIEPGSYVFSWTWNARIGGQPEYYMNCAPVEVAAAKKKRQGPVDRRRAAAAAAAADFPPLFMANMGGGCTTGEALAQQIAIAYPDPGLSVERPEGDNLFPQPCDDNPRARPNDAAPRPTNKPADGNNEAAPAPSTSTSSSSAAVVPTTTATMTTSATTSVITTAVVSSASTTTMMTTTITTTTAATPPPPPASSTTTPVAAPPTETTSSHTSAPSAPSGGEGGDSAASCRHGQLACFDGGKTAWSCTGSTWVKIADAPAGMECSVGVGNGENLVWKPVTV